MPIAVAEIKKLKAPFKVKYDGKKRSKAITVKGFTAQDPLGVGGGLLPDCPTAHFEGGGWLLVRDLMQHYSLVKDYTDAK